MQDQAMAAIEAEQKKGEDSPSDKPVDAKPEQSDAKPEDQAKPVDSQDLPADDKADNKPAEKKDDPTPQAIEIDGEKFTIEDIKRFREDSTNKTNWQAKLTQDAQEISKMKEVADKLRDVFSEKKEKGETLTPEEEKFRKETDTFFQDPYVQEKIAAKAKEILNVEKQEEEKKKTIDAITTEIKNLEKEFDGADGKPKYIDTEVLAWQKENGLLALKPRIAYELKFKNELAELEIQKRLKNQGGTAPKPVNSNASERKPDGEPKKISDDRFVRRTQMLDLMNEMNQGE